MNFGPFLLCEGSCIGTISFVMAMPMAFETHDVLKVQFSILSSNMPLCVRVNKCIVGLCSPTDSRVLCSSFVANRKVLCRCPIATVFSHSVDQRCRLCSSPLCSLLKD